MDFASLAALSNTSVGSISIVKQWNTCKMTGPLYLNVVGLGRVAVPVAPDCGGRRLLQSTPGSDASCWLPDTLASSSDWVADIPLDDESRQDSRGSWEQTSDLDRMVAAELEHPRKVIRRHAGPRSILVDSDQVWPDFTAGVLPAESDPQPWKRRRCASRAAPTAALQRKRRSPGSSLSDPLFRARERKAKYARRTFEASHRTPEPTEPKSLGSLCIFAGAWWDYLLKDSSSNVRQFQTTCMHGACMQDDLCKLGWTERNDDSRVLADQCKVAQNNTDDCLLNRRGTHFAAHANANLQQKASLTHPS
eukprot:TRINITY_DN106164_c0_g1_i1.p1 TRINITY_DN106164_c0_g1~~TRINITY_DN106164_c0_g1_i1.p1  ORF type:complete len:319 (-),score=51.90 TRINITY_DN106164_c0_g1_i1:394-1314(-)